MIRMMRHGCIRPTLGAACAACNKRASTSSGTTATGDEAAHVSPFGDHPIHGPSLLRTERVIGHLAIVES